MLRESDPELSLGTRIIYSFEVRMRPAFLFNCDYFDPDKAEGDFREEYAQASRLFGRVLLCSVDDFFEKGILRIRAADEPTELIYRGWMMSVENYTRFYYALREKNYFLINDPEQYRECHHFPFWYSKLHDYTAESVFMDLPVDRANIPGLLQQFGDSPLMVKDYVKSRKHEWHEACFIPKASDLDNALRVVECFIERQGDDIAGGIVLRKYMDLQMVGRHEKSRMPIARELRVFCRKNIPFACIGYWTGDEDKEVVPERLLRACSCLNSDFYTVDLALTVSGEWVIIEVGDGQVSGLQGYDASRFYVSMLDSLAENAKGEGMYGMEKNTGNEPFVDASF